MNDYVILTDSSCDLPDDIVKKYQLEILQLDFIVEGEGSFHNDQADIGKVYSKLRNGANIKTSAANISQASETIEALFNQKKDILYLGFSSGLSSTYQTVYMAGQELMEEYPERKMISVDTLAASMGQGLLVYKACQAKDAGKSLEENAQYKEELAAQIDAGTVFLFTGNAMEIMEMYIENEDGSKITGLGFFDTYAKRDMMHRYNSLILGKYEDIKLVGFKAQFSHSYGDNSNCYFYDVIRGDGLHPGVQTEGLKRNNFFGTYTIGPFLVLNPLFVKYLMTLLGIKEPKLAYEEVIMKAYRQRLSEFEDEKLRYE